MFGQLECLCNSQGSQKGFFVFLFFFSFDGLMCSKMAASSLCRGRLTSWSSRLYLMLAGVRHFSPLLALYGAADGTQGLVHTI